jgi:hypothetical protein
MVKIIIIIISCIFLALSCKVSKPCLDEVNNFILQNKDLNCEDFYGYTLVRRGRDLIGNEIIRPIEYTNSKKVIFRLPSYITTKDSILNDSLAYAFGKEMQILKNNAKNFSYLKSKYLTEKFLKLNIYKIESQLNLGHFIAVSFDEKCTIWYKKDDAVLNMTYKKLFAEATRIEGNWYMLR